MSTELDVVIDSVQQRVSYLRCATSAPASEGWLFCSELIDDPLKLRAEIDATAPGRGTDDPQVAASLYAQGYAFRVPSIAVAAYALGLPVPSMAPQHVAIRITRDRPGAIAIVDTTTMSQTADQLAVALFEGHLVPFVAAVREGTRVGERLLWGNVAASIATIFRAAQSNGPVGDPDVRDRAAAFERASAHWLDGLGAFSTIDVGEALGWYWDRTSCCLWYQTAGGSFCDDCSLCDPAELTAKRRADLLASVPT